MLATQSVCQQITVAWKKIKINTGIGTIYRYFLSPILRFTEFSNLRGKINKVLYIILCISNFISHKRRFCLGI